MQKRALVRWRVVGFGMLTAVVWGLMLASFSPKEAFRFHLLIGIGFFPFGVMWGSAMCRWMENAARADLATRSQARATERSAAVARVRRDAPAAAPTAVAAHAVGS
jgi:hypothetical protein